MALIAIPPGLNGDRPLVAASPYWRTGFNTRVREGMHETMGLFSPLRDAAGTHHQLPGADPYRQVFATPGVTVGMALAASISSVQVLYFDNDSTPGTGTRYLMSDVSPAGMPPANDVVASPGVGRIEVPPVWWFADSEEIVVGSRANVQNEPVYVWDRNPGAALTAIPGTPTGAVGGGIVSRMLVLLGCTSFTDPDPARFMTVRWSDRFDFADWTPSDVNISGELQLDGGSRIMGGGVVGQGVVVWTDKRMALLSETGNPDSVFARRYIDGGRGLMANRSWCEADGRVWWFDETRSLNVWDGGRPTPVPNPLSSFTAKAIDDRAVARAYMAANQAFNEVILWFGLANADIPDTALVYNYAEQVWSVWRHNRLAYGERVGAIRPFGTDEQNRLYQHELDSAPSGIWLPPPFSEVTPNAFNIALLQDAVPIDWMLQSNLLTTEKPQTQAMKLSKFLIDHLPMPAPGAGDDQISVRFDAYGRATRQSYQTVYTDTVQVAQGETEVDTRVEGRALQVTLSGSQHRTLWRFGQIGFEPTAGAGR